METVEIKFISSKNILTILPLLKILNTNTSDAILKERVLEIATQHYRCIGLYIVRFHAKKNE